MPDSDKIQEFLDKLKPCIDKGELDACVDEAVRLAEEIGISASGLLELSSQAGMGKVYALAYILAGAAAHGLEGKEMADAHYNAGLSAKYLGNVEKAEEQHKLGIKADPKHVAIHSNYGLLLHELKRLDEAEEKYKLAIGAEPELAEPHYNYAILLEDLKKNEEAEEQYKLAIEADSKHAAAHSNYAILLEELNRKEEAEEKYKLAIGAKPELAEPHYNYANLLKDLKRNEEAEKQYKLAIEADSKHAATHSNYAILLQELNRKEEAEEQHKLAIGADPKLAEAHYNYANLLHELKRNEEAEEKYKLAIGADPKLAEVHYNYANLLQELKRLDEAEKQYKLAIEADPKRAIGHSNYAILLQELKRLDEAEEQYKLAIEVDPINATVHGAYGLLLIEKNNRTEAWDKIHQASVFFTESEDFTRSHLAKAWFYERYSEKYFNQRKFPESGEDAGKAGDEYLKAAKTTEGALHDNFSQQGNILKAKSFVRKVPKKSWRRKIPIIGKKSDIPEIINNLKQAAYYYERAAQCPIEEKQDACNACHISITVFSETLSAMEAFLNKRNAEINKKEWIKKLESARLIYEDKKMKNGVALVDTLKQLIKCVDEIAVHRENGLGFQKDKCGKCFGKLADVSENLDGALNVLAEHSIEAIRDYAKKQGMGGFGDYETKKSIWNYWLVRIIIFAVATIFLNIISSKLIDLNVLAIIWNTIKSLIL